jgi:predicted transcriptional regulator
VTTCARKDLVTIPASLKQHLVFFKKKDLVTIPASLKQRLVYLTHNSMCNLLHNLLQSVPAKTWSLNSLVT